MDSILGQDEAVAQLERAVAGGRIHHAWVFAGPRGVGKFTTAIAFAAMLLDPALAPDLTGRLRVDPDGEIARRIAAGSHPDLHVIRKELALVSDDPAVRSRKLSNIPLDVLREHMIGGSGSGDRTYEAVISHTAKMGHRKVFIIDESELLDVTSQNALLKTLEEPPAKTHIVLVTSRPERLLPTIRSRSQLVRFRRLDAASMESWIERAEVAAGDPEERTWLRDFADGAPGVAQLAAEYGFHGWETRLRPMLAMLDRGDWPTEMGDTMAGLVDEFANAWVKNHANASKDAANKDGASHLLGLLGSIARRDLAAAATTGADAEPAMGRIEALRDCEDMLRSNVNLKQALEGLAAAWGRQAQSTSRISARS